MRILSVLLVALFLILSGFSPPAKGNSYKSALGKISATFPSEYSVSNSEGTTYKTTQITSTLDEQNYMVSFTIHETELSKEMSLEQISLDAFANAIGANITSQEKWTSKKGLEGIHAEMRSEESAAVINYTIVFNEDIQYQFAVYAVDNAYDEKKAKAFLKTVKLQ